MMGQYEKNSKQLWNPAWIWVLCVILIVGFTVETNAQDMMDLYSNAQVQELDLENPNSELLKQQVTLRYDQVSIKKLLAYLEQEKDIQFSYNKELFADNPRVTLNLEEISLAEALDAIFKDISIQYYAFDGGYIVLRESNFNEEAQIETVTGTVTDAQSGETLPGVNVIVKGTTTGTSTDSEGNYEFNAPSLQDTLVFSFVGYQTQEVPINGRTTVDVALQAQAIMGEEMVVVGYGEQRRVNITGSVTQVETEELENISTPLLTQSLQGRSPGLFIRNTQGMPGDDEIEMNIRGFGDPLIIVDGTEVSPTYFQQLKSNNIESLNILKDASAAAVYGARAGNGVIVVQTKRGVAGPPTFDFSTRTGLQYFTHAPDFVSSAQYAEMDNVARMVAGGDPQWSQDDIDKFRAGTDPNYPNTDWWSEVFRERGAPSYEGDMSVSGGTENVRYYLSGNYYQQRGFLESDDIKNERYNFLSNLDVELSDRLSLGINLSLTNQDFIAPPVGDLGFMQVRIHRLAPYYKFYGNGGRAGHPDPTRIVQDQRNSPSPYILSFRENAGYTKWNRTFGFVKTNFTYELPWGFAVESNFDLNRTIYEESQWSKAIEPWSYNEETGEYTRKSSWLSSTASVDEAREVEKQFNMQHFLRWQGSFGDHNFNSMFLFERLSMNANAIAASRNEYIFNLPYLDFGNADRQDTEGDASQAGRLAFVGRVNYDFSDKYLLEISARYDASANFAPERRWGFFPSASVGWRISQEDFMDNLDWVSELRLRFSHGLTGYDRAGNFQYLSTYSLQSNYIYEGEETSPGIRVDELPNPRITWEKMRTTNVGLNFRLFDDALEGEVEYFYRNRSDVLGARVGSIPGVVGAEMPPENIEEYDNRGFELRLSHRNSIGNLNFTIGGNAAYQREKIIYVDQPEFATKEGERRGDRHNYWTDHFWVYPTDGLFETQEEVDNWGADIDGNGNASIAPGDIKYIDYNGDGRITEADMIIAGGGGVEGTPKLMFGLNLSLNWRGFDASVLLQGASMYNLNWLLKKDLMHPFWSLNQPITFMYENHFTPENPWKESISADEALWPRYGTDSWNRAHPNYSTDRPSEFWTSDATYLRLKNVVVGYTLPVSITNKVGIDRLRIYASGVNLKTWAKFTDIIDPEQYATYDPTHPPIGNIQFGLELGF